MKRGVTDEGVCYERNPNGTYNVRFDMDSKIRYFTILKSWEDVQKIEFDDVFEWDYEVDEDDEVLRKV